MPDNGEDPLSEPVTVTFTRVQIGYLDKKVKDGLALSRPDAVRLAVNKVIEMEG